MDSLHVDHTINHFSDDFDTNSILKQAETLPNEELEQVIAHCNALIERNTVNMGGVWIIKNVSLI